MTRFFVLPLVALVVAAPCASAQFGLWRADSLLSVGRLADAEAAFYAAARMRPRDPVVRAALGRFVAARGGPRAGAVLLEEARFFGGDSVALARALVPIYARLGDYRALAGLEPSVLSPTERIRVRWLSDHMPQAAIRDRSAMAYRPSAGGTLGTVALRIGRAELEAHIDPGVSGIVVPSGARADLRTFGREGTAILAVAQAVRIGGVTFTNIPVSVAGPADTARVGFDVLEPYAPAFDPNRKRIALHRLERRMPAPSGTRVPALYDASGMRLLIGGRWYGIDAPAVSSVLSRRRWQWDSRRGDVVLTP